MPLHRNVQTPQEIEHHADSVVQEFLRCLTPVERPAVRLVFDEAAGERRAIRATENNGRMELHVHSRDLQGIPALALQGWLELAIATAREQQRAENSCNFQSQILPLMQVAGGALLYIRELVEHLSRSLQRRNVTKMLLEMGRGEPQVSYYFYTIHPSAEEKTMYAKSLPHNWSRASYLCGKLIEYMGLSYLAERDVAFSRALLSDWPKQHGYLQTDQGFLDEMVAVAEQLAGKAFSVRLVAMFKMLRESLLIAGSQADSPPDPGMGN